MPDDAPHRRHRRAPTVLTWGLLGEGKGIEWALEALAGLHRPATRARLPRSSARPTPGCSSASGEAYRAPPASAWSTGSASARMVQFDDRYLDVPDAAARSCAAPTSSCCPTTRRDQVTSGVLTEAVVAGQAGGVHRPSRTPSSCSSGGAGLLVPQRDPAAIRAALRRVLTEPGLAGGDGRRVARPRARPAVAARSPTSTSALGAGARCDARTPVGRLMYPAPVVRPPGAADAPRSGCSSTPCSPSPGPSTATASTTWPGRLVVTSRQLRPSPQVDALDGDLPAVHPASRRTA